LNYPIEIQLRVRPRKGQRQSKLTINLKD